MPISARPAAVRTAFAALAVLVSINAAAAQEPAIPPDSMRVDVPSIDRATTLQAYLYRPEKAGDAPRPAIVMMHGCSGLFNPGTGRFFALYPPWVRALTGAGYVVLVVDSATSRGLGQTCSGPRANVMWRERPKDAYAALTWLQAQPGIAPDRTALMGWSQGGGAALIALNERNAGWVSPAGRELRARLPHDFRAAVAFYPGACSGLAQGMAYPPGETIGWTSKVPLLVLFGDADVWTELAPCKTFLDAARARGNSIELVVYPGAVHAFDAPGMKRLELPQYTTREGRVPVLGTDPKARADVFPRVLGFLAGKLKD